MGKLVADIAQMKAQLSDVLEPKLVPDRTIIAQQLYETVLTDPKPFLHILSAPANLRLTSKFIVHFFHDCLVKRRILKPAHYELQCIEAEND